MLSEEDLEAIGAMVTMAVDKAVAAALLRAPRMRPPESHLGPLYVAAGLLPVDARVFPIDLLETVGEPVTDAALARAAHALIHHGWRKSGRALHRGTRRTVYEHAHVPAGKRPASGGPLAPVGTY